MDHPLAIYIFSNNQAVTDEILDNTNSGGVTVNDFVMHSAVPNAPFGGVGESGYGSYHGIYGFLAFSHQRTVLQMPTWLDSAMGFRYPPFDIKNLAKVKVVNSLGFKRGEGIEDQRLGSQGLAWVLFHPWSALSAVFCMGGRGKESVSTVNKDIGK
jgi:aldehyde dehydrogenase (NAD+)